MRRSLLAVPVVLALGAGGYYLLHASSSAPAVVAPEAPAPAMIRTRDGTMMAAPVTHPGTPSAPSLPSNLPTTGPIQTPDRPAVSDQAGTTPPSPTAAAAAGATVTDTTAGTSAAVTAVAGTTPAGNATPAPKSHTDVMRSHHNAAGAAKLLPGTQTLRDKVRAQHQP